MEWDIIVIGAGPAGMMAAGTAAEKYNDVLLIEKNKEPGRKLSLTGKGRCNLTSSRPISQFFDFINRNSDFLYSAFYTFDNNQLRQFFLNLGLETTVERGRRVFPVSKKSQDVIEALKKYIYSKGVDLKQGQVEYILTEHRKACGIKLKGDNNIIRSDRIIAAPGGRSYPETGSTGDGYDWARRLGHEIIKPKPALVPLKTEEDWVRRADYLKLKNIHLKMKKDGTAVFSRTGELEFTDSGVAGSLVLSASSLIRDPELHNFLLEIDLKPGLSLKQLDQRIIRDFKKYSNKFFKNSLSELLPVKMIPVIIHLSEIPWNHRVNQITRKERKKFAALLKNINLKISRLGSFKEAIVTSGGICVKGLNSSTMESSIIKNLYFCGEVIDVDGDTGGFNLQIAFSTGRLAGISA